MTDSMTEERDRFERREAEIEYACLEAFELEEAIASDEAAEIFQAEYLEWLINGGEGEMHNALR